MREQNNRGWGRSSIVLILVGLIAIQAIRYGLQALNPYRPGSQQYEYIVVNKGQSPNDITKQLLSQHIIEDGKSFVWIGRLTRQWKNIKAGEYRLSPGMSPIEIFSMITSGISAAHPVTVREGENLYEIADDLASKGLADRRQFVKLCKDPQFIATIPALAGNPPPTLEGYLFPDTYFFNRTLTTSEMIRQMVKHFFEFWGPSQEKRASELGLTRHQLITLASIVEKETGAPEERPLISSVFHNRLIKRMRLQSDPTTIYGMWERYKGKIHRSDLLEKNLYNTYAISALPIGPISNPGKEAIQAALYPATSPYYFFVSHNDGTHQFSKTFEEHNAAVRKFQLDPKAREGKSWRDRLRKPAQSNLNNI